MADEENAPSVKKELHELCTDKGGIITPDDVIEYAKQHKSSVIRKRLDKAGAFDRATAIREWPRVCARQLITSVKIMVPDGAGDTFRIRAFTSLDQDRHEGKGYRPTLSVMSDDEMFAQMEATFQKELSHFERRYALLASAKKYRPVFEAIKAVAAG